MNEQRCGYVTLLANIAEKVNQNGLRQTAREYDVDPGNLSAIINGRKPMQEKVANAFGFRSVVVYERILSTRADGPLIPTQGGNSDG